MTTINKKSNKANMPAMLKKLEANATEIAAWSEALGQIADWDSPAAVAIRKHIDTLLHNHGRIMGLPEDEIARINAEAAEAVDQEIQQSIAAAWRAIETADLPREKISEIKRHIDDRRHR